MGGVVLLACAVFTFWLLPRLDHYRPSLEEHLSRTLGHTVTIKRLDGKWQGVTPRFTLKGLSISDEQGHDIMLEEAVLQPSWLSVVTLEPRMALMAFKGMTLDIVRQQEGKLLLNGFALNTQTQDKKLGNWLLRQRLIRLVDTRISWQDAYLGLPRAQLKNGELELHNGLLGHQAMLKGSLLNKAQKTHIALSMHWYGDDINQWRQWTGTLKAHVDRFSLTPWNRYLPVLVNLQAGQAEGTIEIAFNALRLERLAADMSLRNTAYRLATAGLIEIPLLSSQFSIRREAEGYQLNAQKLTLTTTMGKVFDQAQLVSSWKTSSSGGGETKIDKINLAPLDFAIRPLLTQHFPSFAHFSPTGTLQNFLLSWQGQWPRPQGYQLESSFDQLSWEPVHTLAGVKGVSGSVRFDQEGGMLALHRLDGLSIPRVFPKALHFNTFSAVSAWRKIDNKIELTLNRVRFSNADLSGTLTGHYQFQAQGAGTLALQGKIEKLKAVRVADYLPFQAGENTRRWLNQALHAGLVESATLQLSGELDRFPFRNGKGGVFQVEGLVKNAQLKYHPAWPSIDGLDAQLLFRNERMDIIAKKAQTLQINLNPVNVSIADLGADEPILQVEGRASGKLQDMLRFSTQSPVNGWLSGFISRSQALGNSALDLSLSLPLDGPNPAQVKGQLTFMRNHLELNNPTFTLPPLDQVNGELQFTEKGVYLSDLRFVAFGGPFRLSASTDVQHRMRFNLSGQADSAKVAAQYLPAPLGPAISGKSIYKADFSVLNGLEYMRISSDLVGTTLRLPAPANKPAALSMPLQLNLSPQNRFSPFRATPLSRRSVATAMRLDFSLGSLALGQFRFADNGRFQTGFLSLGSHLEVLPKSGLVINLASPALYLDAWSSWATNSLSSAHSANFPIFITLTSPKMVWSDYVLHDAVLKLMHPANKAPWHLLIDATELKGELDYSSDGVGQIRAHLPLLELKQLPDTAFWNHVSGKNSEQSLPVLDIYVDNLIYRKQSLGSLSVKAKNKQGDWLFDTLTLKNPDGVISGSLHVMASDSVNVRYTIDSQDLGKMLERFGITDTFRKGQGSITGDMSWVGQLQDFNIAHLSGQLSLDLKDGRFAKVNSGATRLLSILSLQSLSSRLRRLDFTDVFSEGFAFNSLKGNAHISLGIFKTDNITMQGVAADVRIRGQVNLVKETQDLELEVEPHMAESVALATGAALINPVVGVAAFAAQKVFQDPVGKIFTVKYHVTGSLQDPVISKTKPSQTPTKEVSPP